MLKRCSSLGKKNNVHVNSKGVSKGHFVVYVGLSRSRHVIPISFLVDYFVYVFTIYKEKKQKRIKLNALFFGKENRVT